MTPIVLEEISRLDWNGLTRKLTAVSIYWSKMYHGERWNFLPKGFTHDDVVQESIRRGFSRNWEHYDEKEFVAFLMGSVRSIVSNLAKSAKVQKTYPADLFSIEDIEDSDIENEFEQEGAIQRIRVKLGSDPLLNGLLDGIVDGLSPQKISDKLNFPVKEIYNAKKRLIRIVENASKEIKGYGKA